MITILKHNPTRGLERSDHPDPALLSLAPNEHLWVDLEEPTPEEEKVLNTAFRFHPLSVEDALTEIEYPKLDVYDEYAFLVLHGIDYLIKSEKFSTAEVNIFLGKNFVVTFHRHRMRSVHYAQDRILNDPTTLTRGVDMLLHLILDRMVDNYFPDIEKLEDRIQALEEEVFTAPGKEALAKILKLKRDVLHFKRIVYPQREVFNRLSRDELAVVQPATRMYFRDIYDNLFRMTDVADSYRDLLSGILEAYLSSVSNRLNEVMKALTIVLAIFTPLTVISGIYGMNFAHLPLAGSPYGFYVSVVAMVLISLGMLAFFKHKNWI